MSIFNNITKLLLGFTFFSLSISSAFAQMSQISIEECQEKARTFSPLAGQNELIQLRQQFELSIANANYLPKASLSGKATYQSDTSELPINMPGFSGLDKDQYQIAAELSQSLWDGGTTSAQKKIIQANGTLDKKRLAVSLYSLRAAVDSGFFGMLMANEQLEQNRLLQAELDTNYSRIQSYLANGIANKSELSALEVERLNAHQKRIELLAARKSAAQFLSVLIGEIIAEDANLIRPKGEILLGQASFDKRPELAVFSAQETLLDSKKDIIRAGLKPRIGLFIQGGYGKPSLNMFNADPGDFYLAGVRLSWNLDGFFTLTKSLNEIDTEKEILRSQKESLLLNLSAEYAQNINEIQKTQDLIKLDTEIIALREQMKTSTQEKLSLGAASVNDLIRDINAENLAKQMKALHEIQWLRSVYTLKNTLNE